MFGMGGSEIIVILIVALLFLGPDKLPEAAKTISKGIRDIKKQSRNLQQTIENDERIGGAIRDLKSALRGEDEPYRAPVKKKVPQIEVGDEVVKAAALIAPGLDPAEVMGDQAPDPGEAARGVAEAAEPVDAVVAKPAPLVTAVGERDPLATAYDDDDDAELAAMIKPAAGIVAKGEPVTATADDKRHG